MELLLTNKTIGERISANCPQLRLDQDAEQIASREGTNPNRQCAPRSIGLRDLHIGSSGKPKGVAVEHQALSNLLFAISKSPGMSSSDVMMAVATVAFDIAGLELFLPLAVGARVVIGTESVVSMGGNLRARWRLSA